MFCTKCGTQLPDGSRFCSNCGTPVAAAEEPKAETIINQPEETPKAEPQMEVNDTSAADSVRFSTYDDAPEVQEGEQPVPEKKKKKKTGLIIGIIASVLVVLALAAAALFLFVFNKDDTVAIIDAYVDSSGNAYVCYGNGKKVKIGGDIESAVMTPDRSKIIVVEKEGLLYWTDVKKSEKNKIADLSDGGDVEMLDEDSPLTDKFLVYSISNVGENGENIDDGNIEVFRYDFKNGKNVSIASVTAETFTKISAVGSDAAFYGVDDDVSFAVAEDGEISVLAPDSNKLKKIASYEEDEDVELLGISSDGELVAWTQASAGEYSIIIYRDGKERTVFTDEADAPEITEDNYLDYFSTYITETYDSSKYKTISEYSSYVGEKWADEVLKSTERNPEKYFINKLTEYFKSKAEAPAFDMNISPNGKLFVILGDEMTFYSNGKDTEKVTLPKKITNGYDIYTTNGLPIYADKNAHRAHGYYVELKDDDGKDGESLYSLYLVSFKDGEHSKLVSGAKWFDVVEDSLIYKDKNDNAYIAEINAKKGDLENEQRIGNELRGIKFALDCSDYLYYLKKNSSNEDTYDLYLYDVSEEDSDKIASNVHSNFYVSTDGEQVFYFEDVTDDKNGLVSYGKLKAYSVKEQDSRTVASDVVVGSLTSNLMSGDIDPRSAWFEKYVSGEEETYTCDICYYNGKKCYRAVKDLEY